jgi:PPP family 3-phenylpropionic acid transporter
MPANTHALHIGKALYFFMFAGMGIFFPFLNVYYKSIGLSGTQIGLIITLGPLIAIFAGPMWGLLVDRLGRLRLILVIIILGSIFSVLGLGMMKSFFSILVLVAVFNLFGCAIQPMVDSYNLSLLGEHRERYSEQRLWGTFGFLATSLFSGSLFERVGLSYVFFGYAVCLGLLLLTLIWLPPTTTHMGRTVLNGFTQMLRHPVWITLAAAVILVMIANNTWLNFLGITVKEMGAKDSLVGWMWSVGAISEIPVMIAAQVGRQEGDGIGILFLWGAPDPVCCHAQTGVGAGDQLDPRFLFRILLGRRGELCESDHSRTFTGDRNEHVDFVF